MATQKEYLESDAAKQAKDALEQQNAVEPGDYQSKWQPQLQDTIEAILNRKDFSYDVSADALYQQYKDRYGNQGRLAMADTMGQAAALTGGYGNSYAQTAGQQAYQGYLQELNDVIPELYQLALDRYNQSGQELYNQYSMLGTQEQQDYGRYQDSLDAWNAERDWLYGQYRDQVGDDKWQAEFDEDNRRYDQEWAAAHPVSTGSSGRGGASSGRSGSAGASGAMASGVTGALSSPASGKLADQLAQKAYQEASGTVKSAVQAGVSIQTVMGYIQDMVSAGYLTQEQGGRILQDATRGG